MLQNKRNIIFVIIVSIVILSKICFAFDDGDYQYWNTENMAWKINDEWKAKVEAEFRFGDNASDFYYQHSDLGFSYLGIADWLELSFNYRQIFEKKSGVFRYENVPHFNAVVKWMLLDFSLSDRSRFEYKNREEAENYWRYRNKLTIKAPFKLIKLDIQPYIADEIFYDFNIETLNRNRFYAGFSFKLFSNLKADIFYLWQASEKNDKWNDTNALGTKFKLSF